MSDKQRSAHQIKRNKRGNRNAKKSIRKLDTDDIDREIDARRHAERTGINIASENNDSLFFVDAKARTNAQETVKDRTRVMSRKEKARAATLHCDLHLAANKHIKAVSSRKSKYGDSSSPVAVSGGVEHANTKESKRRRTASATDGVAPNRDDSFIVGSSVGEIKALDEALLWDKPLPTKTDIDTNPFLVSVKEWHTRKLVSRKSARITAAHKTTVSAIEIPSEGISYNPTYEAHQDLISTLHIAEEKRLAAIKKIDVEVPIRLNDVEAEAAAMKELSVGFGDGDNILDQDDGNYSDEVDSVDEEYYMNKKRPNVEKRKTRQQKNRALRAKAREAESKAKKALLRRENEVFRLKALKKEAAEQSNLEAERAAVRVEKATKALARPRRLGREKFSEAKPAFKLTEELVGELRSLKPEGNVMTDRFKSFQKRNMIEPRKKHSRGRKYQMAQFQQRVYKDYDQQQQIKEKEKAREQMKAVLRAEKASLFK